MKVVPRVILLLSALFLTSLTQAQEEQTTLGGYGELHYNEPDGASRGQLDFHRFVLFIGHTFNNQLSFKSELELEHTKLEAGSSDGGEIALEQAYLDWHFSQHFGLRAGILLPPVGIVNQIHEPPTFHGVERPNVERIVIPTTWRESGIGFYGKVPDGVGYQLYVTAGLRAAGFSGASGIRGGRQEALESSPADPSITGRLDYMLSPELNLGGSIFVGNSTGGDSGLGSGRVELICADAQFNDNQTSLRGLVAFTSIGDADKINAAYGNDVADQIFGFYVEGAYNIMPWLDAGSEMSLSPFVRYEKYDTHAKVTGIIANPLNNRNEVTIGATLKPTFNTVFKVDYQFMNNAAGNDTKRLNLGMGYHFF